MSQTIVDCRNYYLPTPIEYDLNLKKKRGNKKNFCCCDKFETNHKPNSVDDKISLQTFACDKIANKDLFFPSLRNLISDTDNIRGCF